MTVVLHNSLLIANHWFSEEILLSNAVLDFFLVSLAGNVRGATNS